MQCLPLICASCTNGAARTFFAHHKNKSLRPAVVVHTCNLSSLGLKQ
jgi:hypothetical protein